MLNKDYPRQTLEIDLVDDAGIGRDDGQVAEGGLSPAEEGIALFVALEFEQGVHVEGVGAAEFIDLDGVVDYQFDRLEGVDQGGIAAEVLHGIAHGGQVDYAGDAGEILKQNAAGSEGDFFIGPGIFVPFRQGGDVFFFYVAAVFGAQEIFEKDAEGVWKMFARDALFIEGVETVDFVFLVAGFEYGAGVEAV